VKVLVTGSAGFIGAALIERLLARGDEVVGIDNLNDYYEVRLKHARLARNQGKPGYVEFEADLADTNAIQEIFRRTRPQRVVNLAAQAGVRYSLKNPQAYLSSNVVGFGNILECARLNEVEHVVFASSSSVYGANTKMPFAVTDNVDHPVSLYAATKKANELMAHSYAHLYALPCTGLRFFTVYGPWGRPDMAYYGFTQKILAGQSIDVFNHGKMMRDFTYIDDVIAGVLGVLDHIPTGNPTWSGDHPDPGSSYAPYRIYNIGNNQPVELERFISVLEASLGAKARRNYLPMQPGDVAATFADISALQNDVGYRPSTTIEQGLARFVEWYRQFHDTNANS
jgi:UDP-glucuronate 4-epimerase